MIKKVILITDNHTHEGVKRNAGDVLELSEDQANYLIKLKAAEPAEKNKKEKE